MLTLRTIQNRGYFFMSPDGYALSRGAYSTLTGDKTLSGICAERKEFALPEVGQKLQKSHLLTSATDAFWVVCDFLPDSFEFIANVTPPWSVCFAATGEQGVSKVYEIAKISRGNVNQIMELFRTLPKVPEDDRKQIVRIIILEDWKDAPKVRDGFGIKYVIGINETRPRGYQIIRKMEGDKLWD